MIKTILIIITIWLVVKYVLRLITPYLLKKAVEKMEKKAQEQYRNTQEPDIKEGETIIEKKPSTIKESNKEVGEYIDFEEIE